VPAERRAYNQRVDTQARPEKLHKALRCVARVVCTLAALFWVLTGLAHAVVEPAPLIWESWVLAALIVAAAVAVAIAWWRERIGGPAVLAVGVAFSTFALITSGHNHAFAMLITGGPFLLSGLLFLSLRPGAGLR